jgi:glycosyltransferase involved in cell wall biosynthesis
MAMELPVVASDIPAIAETAPDGEVARLVPPGDADGLARALLAVLADAAGARDMGHRGRQRYLERYTLDAMATSTAALYRSLLGG